MKTLLKNAREQKNLKTREVAQILGIDQALISKFESGTRKPTREQVAKLAALLEFFSSFYWFKVFWLISNLPSEIVIFDPLALSIPSKKKVPAKNKLVVSALVISTYPVTCEVVM